MQFVVALLALLFMASDQGSCWWWWYASMLVLLEYGAYLVPNLAASLMFTFIPIFPLTGSNYTEAADIYALKPVKEL